MAISEARVMAPQVSVIIPARNEEANLGTCLESLMDQDQLFSSRSSSSMTTRPIAPKKSRNRSPACR